MQQPSTVLDIFKDYSFVIEDEISKLLQEQKAYQMYGMMEYFFGFKDENLNHKKVYGGKRFRSGLCLLVADMYGNMKKVIEMAASIEIFHNFTLIHDDIIDNDPLRRGRKTIWKIWGINHAINTGDAQFLLSQIETNNAIEKYGKPAVEAQKFLQKMYLEIVEGQYLDIYLTDIQINHKDVTEENYLQMIKNKTSVIIGGASKVAGIMTGINENEIEELWNYGVNLGIAYQLCDDLVSIWASEEFTGKISANDLREKKKTLPMIYLYQNSSIENKKIIEKIYNKDGKISENEINILVDLLDNSGAYDYTWNKLNEFMCASFDSIEKLSISRENKDKLIEINKALLPNVKEVCKC